MHFLGLLLVLGVISIGRARASGLFGFGHDYYGGLTFGEISLDHYHPMYQIGGYGHQSKLIDISVGEDPTGHFKPVVKEIGVPVVKEVKIEVPEPVVKEVPQPYPVLVPVREIQPYEVVRHEIKKVEKKVPQKVDKIVPVPIEKPVPYEVIKHVPEYVEKKVPIKVPIYKTIYHKIHTKHG